jgi:hypothetical protein
VIRCKVCHLVVGSVMMAPAENRHHVSHTLGLVVQSSKVRLFRWMMKFLLSDDHRTVSDYFFLVSKVYYVTRGERQYPFPELHYRVVSTQGKKKVIAMVGVCGTIP